MGEGGGGGREVVYLSICNPTPTNQPAHPPNTHDREGCVGAGGGREGGGGDSKKYKWSILEKVIEHVAFEKPSTVHWLPNLHM